MAPNLFPKANSRADKKSLLKSFKATEIMCIMMENQELLFTVSKSH